MVMLVALLTSGCAGPEQKLGHGMNNVFEIVRMGEMRRSVEQSAVLDSPGAGYTVGALRGLDRSLARTGLGAWETATFLLPYRYDPVYSGGSRLFNLKPDPVFPESYKPGRLSDALFDTDTYTGFSGGDVAPFIPGSRFKIFDN